MNDLPPTIENPPPPTEPPRQATKLPVAIGFVVGAAFWAIPFSSNLRNYNGVGWLFLDAFVLPVVSAILAAIRPTRRVGLGLLLACGLGWLVLGAMCGGLIR